MCKFPQRTSPSFRFMEQHQRYNRIWRAAAHACVNVVRFYGEAIVMNSERARSAMTALPHSTLSEVLRDRRRLPDRAKCGKLLRALRSSALDLTGLQFAQSE